MKSLGFHCNQLHHLDEGILKNDLKRGEFYNFPPEDLPELRKQINRHDLAMSIHCPLERADWYPSPPTWSFLCNADNQKRELNLKLISRTMEIAEDFGAEHVVVHFPSPGDKTVSLSEERQREIALDSCHRLAEMSEKHKTPIHLEGFGPSPLFTPEFLIEVLTQFHIFRYCIDTGHLNIMSRRDGFDYFDFVRKLAPYVGSVHLWNSRCESDYWAYRHIPVHPSQSPDGGWADIEGTLRLLLNGQPSRPSMIFENGHTYPKELGDYDYRDGVKWVKELLKTLS